MVTSVQTQKFSATVATRAERLAGRTRALLASVAHSAPPSESQLPPGEESLSRADWRGGDRWERSLDSRHVGAFGRDACPAG
jgi:hypothetical protein